MKGRHTPNRSSEAPSRHFPKILACAWEEACHWFPLWLQQLEPRLEAGSLPKKRPLFRREDCKSFKRA
eukprot:scaffold8681_cov200-Amphora_coffeaeformis.AAC.7